MVALTSGSLTLVANTASTVTFDGDLNSVEVINLGSNSADVWYTLDGSTATVGGGYYVPAGSVDTRQPKTASSTTVSVISSGTPTIVVQRGD